LPSALIQYSEHLENSNLVKNSLGRRPKIMGIIFNEKKISGGVPLILRKTGRQGMSTFYIDARRGCGKRTEHLKQ